MNIIQMTDVHIRDSEPFFKACIALDSYILNLLERETEPFIFLDSGDRFHTSKETGRVNGEVVRFFSELSFIKNCKSIYIMQGNHDIKESTGSALEVLRHNSFYGKLTIVNCPLLVRICDSDDNLMYLLPYCKPYSMIGFESMKSYENECFHKNYWSIYGSDCGIEGWDVAKKNIKMVSMHGGDETSGNLFMDANISFLQGLKSNGHIHKPESQHCLPSAMITRRDEADKKCVIRKIDTTTWTSLDIELPLFLNYAYIEYGKNIDDYFKSNAHILPKESLIVDIYGHDDSDSVAKEYKEKWKNRKQPTLYVGEVYPIERRGITKDGVEVSEGTDITTINIKEMLKEFCKVKNVASSVLDNLIQRIA